MTQQRSIMVNQVGYPVRAPKQAAFLQAGSFKVVDQASGAAVYEGSTAGPIHDEASGDTLFTGDFTPVSTPGTYRIESSGRTSASFVIDPSPYHDLHKGLLKAFYYYRCGTELTESFAGPWTHQPCHLSPARVHGDESRMIDGCGGWHDAGDYGKYVGPGAKAAADLLLAYEFYPQAFKQPIPIPESDGRMPDVLHECRWELDWLFKMQEPESGGLFHKLTTLQFPGLAVLPEDDRADLYAMPISATATANFAAVMALASRIYRPFDSSFADRALAAAKKAWAWLEQNPDVPGFRNPSDVGTGEYGDERHIDERFWAAAELYRTTGENSYHEAFKRYAGEPFSKTALGWADMGGYGTISYIWNDNADSSLKEKLKAELRSEADRLLAQAKQDGYRITLRPEQYRWGSNMDVMHNAMILLLVHRLFGGEAYEACALDHVHYLTGRNAMDISYVSGFGERSVNHLHYRPGVADDVEQAVPGFVSGGPNKGLQDECARRHLQGNPPARCFIDHIDSYSTNEVTVYWNSPAVFAVSHWVN
jgi:endoglucanase